MSKNTEKAPKCGSCNREASGHGTVVCSTCSAAYHKSCALQPGYTRVPASGWVCPACVARRPRYNTDNSPVRGQTVPKLRSPSPVRIGSGDPATSSTVTAMDLTSFAASLRSFQQEFKSVETRIQQFKAALNDCEETAKNATRDLEAVQRRLSELEERDRGRDAELDALRRRVYLLEQQRDEREQSAMRNELEINGITEAPGENLCQIISVLAVKIDVQLQPADVDSVSRVGPRKPTGGGERGLKSDELSVAGPTQQVYVGERLTHFNRMLLKRTRDLAKQHSYKYVWVRGGKILVRRQDGERADRVANEQDIFRLFGEETAAHTSDVLVQKHKF